MKRARYIAGLVAVAALLLAACASEETAPPPPEIAYGLDACAECNMIISEPRFAAASLTADGAMSKFDDIGDMLAFHAKQPELAVRAWFVHDYDTEDWLRGEAAFFVASASVHSPMGHGIAAFAQRADAETFARDVVAAVLTFDELRANYASAANNR